MPSSTLVVHQRERQMKQPMGPPAYGAAGRAGADALAPAAEKILNEPPIGVVDRRTAASDAARASTKPRGKFYLGSAAVLLLVVLVGFAPTFYLRAAFGAPELSWSGVCPRTDPDRMVPRVRSAGSARGRAPHGPAPGVGLGRRGDRPRGDRFRRHGDALPDGGARRARAARAPDGRPPRSSCGRIRRASSRSPSCSRQRLFCGAGRTRTNG